MFYKFYLASQASVYQNHLEHLLKQIPEPHPRDFDS